MQEVAAQVWKMSWWMQSQVTVLVHKMDAEAKRG